MGSSSGECQVYVNITEEAVSEWLFTPVDTIIITVIMPIMLSIGFIGNFTFLFLVVSVRRLRVETNIYLAHLALADLLYLGVSTLHHNRRFADSLLAKHVAFATSAGCISHYTVVNTGYFASIVFVTMVSFERYLALCHPMLHLKIRGNRRTNAMVIIGWLVGFAFAAVTTTGGCVREVTCLRWPDNDAYQTFPSTITSCNALRSWVVYYNMPLLNVPWFIAMVSNIYMYVRIVQILNKRRSSDGRVEDNQKAVQIRNQVAKMLIINGAVFFICQTPYRVISLTGWTSLLAQVPNPLGKVLVGNAPIWITLVPQQINTIVNPLIYGVINSQYRRAFFQAFGCEAKPVRQFSSSARVISRSDTSVL